MGGSPKEGISNGMRKVWLALGIVVFWCGWPALWVYLHNSRRTRLLLICNNEFLVLRGWIGSGSWGLPGGGLHKNEKPLTGLLREVKEETGLDFTKNQPAHLFSDEYKEYGFSFAYDAFVLEVNQKPEINTQRWEIVGYSWQSIKNPSDRLSQETFEVLERWRSRE